VLANDSGLSGDNLTVTGTTTPAHGTLAMNPDGSFSYDPAAGYIGMDSCTYTVSDGTSTQTGSVTFNVADAPPVAPTQSYIARPGESLVVAADTGLLANATDPNGDILSVTATSTPAHGTVVAAANGGFTYTPAAGYYGAGYYGGDSFTYTVTDGTQTTQGTADIQVQDAPFVTVLPTYSVDYGKSLTIPAATGVLSNDYSLDGYKLSATLENAAAFTAAGDGTVSLASDGSFTYTPPPPANPGPYQTGLTVYFSYDVSDGTQTLFREAKIFVNNPGSNGEQTSLAVASPDVYVSRPGQTVTGNVTANDMQADGFPYTATLQIYNGPNSLVLNSDGSFVFTPVAGFSGVDQATYGDVGQGGAFSATVMFEVVNSPPTPTADAYAVQSGKPFTATAAQGLLANDYDLDHDPITVSSYTQPGHGSVTVGTDGSFTYTPTPSYMGSDSFTYVDSDPYSQSQVTKVTLTVADTGPMPNNEFYLDGAGQTLTRTAANGLLANASDPDAVTIVAQEKAAPAHGSVSVAADGSFSYTPTAGFTGTDNFTFTVSDGVITNTGTATVQVACFAHGTHIATPHGETRVEDLCVGDSVCAHFATEARIAWIGRRRVNCRKHPRPADVWPVIVAPGAFGPGRPARDLFLSPDHAIFVNGVLIPIKLLIDGVAVRRCPVDEIVYFHVALDTHDVLLADGLPCESFLDTGDRAGFDNGGAAIDLHPNFAARLWDASGCAPLIVAGPHLDAARALLAALTQKGSGLRRSLRVA
jgi:hypothetical protein